MTDAVVHIGTPKTGTTSIQHFLLTNSAALDRAGYRVPDRWGANHSALTVLSRPEDTWDEPCSYQCRRLGYGPRRPDAAAWRQVRQALREELRSLVDRSDGRTLVFSSESLYMRLGSVEIGRFRDLMDDVGIRARIVVYLRQPLSFRISQMGQLIRSGWIVDFAEAFTPGVRLEGRPRPAWRGAVEPGPEPLELYSIRLRAWEEAFPGRVDVRLYDPTQPSSSLVSDFCDAIGLEGHADVEIPDRVNESLSWPFLKALNEVNRQVNRRALTADGDYNEGRSFRPWLLSAGTAPERFRPGSERVRSFDAYFSASDDAIRARYFAQRSTLWPLALSDGHGVEAAEASSIEPSDEDARLAQSLLDRIERERRARTSRVSAASRLVAGQVGRLARLRPGLRPGGRDVHPV